MTDYTPDRGFEYRDVAWSNWTKVVRGQVQRYSTPRTVDEVVAIVRAASAEHLEVRAVGNGWSQAPIAYTPGWMVDLRLMKDRPRTLFAHPTDDEAGPYAHRTDQLLHVESGVEIAHLTDELSRLGLGLPALGGANGQTLAGAISTGVHGGDPSTPPIHDFVVAVHLVTAGGRELWVEGSTDPVTDDDRLALALGRPDVEIVRQDDVLRAVQVAVGRFGIICSCVVRVVPEFWVSEVTVEWPRAVVWSALRQGQSSGDLHGPLLSQLPAPPSVLKALDDGGPQGLEVVLDTQNREMCYVRRRWLTHSRKPIRMDYQPDEVCRRGVKHLFDEVRRHEHLTDLVQIIEPLRTLREEFDADPSLGVGDLLARGIDLLYEMGLHGVLPAITRTQFQQRYADSLAGRRGPYPLVATGHRAANQQNCYRGESVEPVFDAANPGFMDFLDAVLIEMGRTNPPHRQVGYISLRWSGRSSAPLSMHHVESSTAVAVEISSLGGLSRNAQWLALLEDLAVQHGGRMHWGQAHALPQSTTDAVYGADVRQWRSMLHAVSGDDQIFSNAVTRRCGLEPVAGGRAPISGTRTGDVLQHLHGQIEALLVR
ncbi:FAD-binding protein [Kineococcus sp. SYSU DK001]|uniref:FAD-binding protein n=1 Tax=Kineococcus sp. SYSU DK001 TaxID=3383122 RepID=UPI003D7D8F5B